MTDTWSTLKIGEWAPLRRLEQLHLSGMRLVLGPLRLPSLRTLVLHVRTIDEQVLPAWADGMLGALEQFELRVTNAPQVQTWEPDYTETLRELLRATPLPRLRTLRVEIYNGTIEPPLVAALFDAPFVNGLERLELLAHPSADARALFERRRETLARVQVTLGPPS